MSTPSGQAISAVIVCHNEADRLEPCLQSVSWTDEVVVLDFESSDGAASTAVLHGARVITHAPRGDRRDRSQRGGRRGYGGTGFW